MKENPHKHRGSSVYIVLIVLAVVTEDGSYFEHFLEEILCENRAQIPGKPRLFSCCWFPLLKTKSADMLAALWRGALNLMRTSACKHARNHNANTLMEGRCSVYRFLWSQIASHILKSTVSAQQKGLAEGLAARFIALLCRRKKCSGMFVVL